MDFKECTSESFDGKIDDIFSEDSKELSAEETAKLELQNSRIVPEFKANKLEIDSKKYWDIFYKRNETRFFKDRNWTTREFKELTDCNFDGKVLFEVGCGVGNFFYPLLDIGFTGTIYACDLSPRAIELVKSNEKYNPSIIKAFVGDITSESFCDEIEQDSVDVVTLIFVLSAIHPEKHKKVVKNIYKILKPGGLVLFRDYGLYDMTQLRFKPGHKIFDNFYMRQDGTRSYFFTTKELTKLFAFAGFQIVSNTYVHRRTINVKERIDVPRIFVQAKFCKS